VVFLRLNGVPAELADNDAVYDFVIWVAAGDDDLDVIATGLRRLIDGT
jgi:hypothetical protein